jgi:ethanolamine utilization microcompartment shell protein EutS
MANITQLKHLEHLEDEMLNYGVEGCHAAVSFLKELRQMVGKSSSSLMQTKWDGAPSIVCGQHPLTGRFFVGTKSVFNKTEPKLCYFDENIDTYYGNIPDLRDKMKVALSEFQKLDIKGVIQGDLLYTTDVKEEEVDGEKLYTFRPNTITYGIPVNHPLGEKCKSSKIGVVFHTHYTGDDLESMQAKGGVPDNMISESSGVLNIKNTTPMTDVNFTTAEFTEFDRHVEEIERMCRFSGAFLDELLGLKGTKGDAKWHISSYMKQFFNDQIKKAQTIANPDKALADMINFYDGKVNAAASKLTAKTQVQKKNLIYKSQNFAVDNADKFKGVLKLYKELQAMKTLVIGKLDELEHTIKTFVMTDKGYKITAHEGYVLHKGGDMIKFVNRIEFSYNNFTLAKQWR